MLTGNMCTDNCSDLLNNAFESNDNLSIIDYGKGSFCI